MVKVVNKGRYLGNTTDPGNPRWDEYEDPETGESTLQVHRPEKLTNYEDCKEHYFIMTDKNGNIECSNCHYGTKIVWGIDIVKNGKIIHLSHNLEKYPV